MRQLCRFNTQISRQRAVAITAAAAGGRERVFLLRHCPVHKPCVTKHLQRRRVRPFYTGIDRSVGKHADKMRTQRAAVREAIRRNSDFTVDVMPVFLHAHEQ